MAQRRVVVTGMGVVSPVGNTVEEAWDSVKNGKCGVGPITLFNTEEFPVKIAAEVKDCEPERYGLSSRDLRKTARLQDF